MHEIHNIKIRIIHRLRYEVKNFKVTKYKEKKWNGLCKLPLVPTDGIYKVQMPEGKGLDRTLVKLPDPK
jgi:hypothetical protein